MILNDIKTKAQQEKGFTIVELLIVVVVIAILAAITIVSYNGITNRANSSAALSTAASLQKKIELFSADGPTGQYPVQLSDLTGSAAIKNVTPAQTTTSSNTWYVAPNTIKVSGSPATAPPTNTDGKNTVQYQPCGTFSSGLSQANMTSVTGAIITWNDFAKTDGTATKSINVGTTTAGTCATS
jgi:prepilin-type N-terminal cleavage/methylation domain-containing protein